VCTREVSERVFRLFHVLVGKGPQEVGFDALGLDAEDYVKKEDSLVELFESDVTAGRLQVAVTDYLVYFWQILHQVFAGWFIRPKARYRLGELFETLEVAGLLVDGLRLPELLSCLRYLLVLQTLTKFIGVPSNELMLR